MKSTRRPLALAALAASGQAAAHGGATEPLSDPSISQWAADPWFMWTIVLLALAGGLYAQGLLALWSRAGRSHGIRIRQALAFGGGWLVLIAALTSPIDTYADRLFAVHMIQHELLMVVAAPLLVYGRPLAVWTWALTQRVRRPFTSLLRAPPLRRGWQALMSPAVAWWVHTLAIWVWHVPVLFIAAIEDDAIHAAQHASFLFSALAFWWVVMPHRGGRVALGRSMLLLFSTMLHTGFLAALLTFAPKAWYLDDANTAPFGWTALEDQQLGGLIMWIPAGIAYPGAALWLLFVWLQSTDGQFRSRRRSSADVFQGCGTEVASDGRSATTSSEERHARYP